MLSCVQTNWATEETPPCFGTTSLINPGAENIVTPLFWSSACQFFFGKLHSFSSTVPRRVRQNHLRLIVSLSSYRGNESEAAFDTRVEPFPVLRGHFLIFLSACTTVPAQPGSRLVRGKDRTQKGWGHESEMERWSLGCPIYVIRGLVSPTCCW